MSNSTRLNLEKAGIDSFHIDIMDGRYVPNFAMSLNDMRYIASVTKKPLDVHLMIDRPDRYIADFAKYSDRLGFHLEAGSPVAETLSEIRRLGCSPTLTIKPATPASALFPYLHLCDMVLVMSVEPGFGGQSFMPSAIDKIRDIRAEATRLGIQINIEVDGGINAETGKLCADAGADVLVAGSYVFGAKDIAGAVTSLKVL